MKLTKLANWFSEKDPEKHQPKIQPSSEVQAKLSRKQSKIDQLSNDLQTSQKELAQVKAQLQINQGFRVELGETQIKLQQNEAKLQLLKQELFEQQKHYNVTESQLKHAQQSLAQFTASQNWLHQIQTPIEIIEIRKTLPKQDFETLWGFGIISPASKSIITTGAILVKGWVLGKKAQAQTVTVKYNNESLLETPVELRRSGIVQQYPDIPNAGNSGFEFSLAVAGMSDELELSLETKLSDTTIVPLCNFILKPQSIESKDT